MLRLQYLLRGKHNLTPFNHDVDNFLSNSYQCTWNIYFWVINTCTAILSLIFKKIKWYSKIHTTWYYQIPEIGVFFVCEIKLFRILELVPMTRNGTDYNFIVIRCFTSSWITFWQTPLIWCIVNTMYDFKTKTHRNLSRSISWFGWLNINI